MPHQRLAPRRPAFGVSSFPDEDGGETSFAPVEPDDEFASHEDPPDVLVDKSDAGRWQASVMDCGDVRYLGGFATRDEVRAALSIPESSFFFQEEKKTKNQF